MAENKEISDWIYKGKKIQTIDDLKNIDSNVYGFVYLLSLYDKKTKNLKYQYIGKKNLFSIRNRDATKKELENNPKSTFKRKRVRGGKIRYLVTVVKESDWKIYISSNDFIRKNKTRFLIKREILGFSNNDSDLTYLEAKEIICQGALECPNFLNDGVSIRRFGKKLVK